MFKHLNDMTTEQLIARMGELELAMASDEAADDAQLYDVVCEEHAYILNILDERPAPQQFSYTFDAAQTWEGLPNLTICGVNYAPLCGSRVSEELAAKRKAMVDGLWSERACRAGYYVTYAVVGGMAIGALGR